MRIESSLKWWSTLRLPWRDDLSMDALLGLRDELDDMLGRVRSTRHISNHVCVPRAGT